METKANYVLIGAFTIAVAVFGLLFALWAAKYASDRSWEEYAVVFNEPVTGLSEGSSVQYNGIAVGSVESLQLSPDDPRQVVARLRIDARTPVKVDTRARMSMTSLTGPPIIQLTGGSPDSPRLATQSDREVPIILTEPSALQNIADTANRLVERLDKLLSEDNIAKVDRTLTHIEAVTGALGEGSEDISGLLRSARAASERLERTLDSADSAITDFDRGFVQELPQLIDKLDRTLTRLDSAADGADAILNENRAAISNFANDGLGQLGPTLSELRSLIRDLRRISDRLENNPARYLLGRDAPKEFEPE
ncbi:MlaD family protein [Luteimonas sp. RD2P54]|uniref:MlaD family protein n=1 Tax=Luteimonas endophytica TaxID=3042023 RepID=A0ABT6JDX3_9GAMM|nr:MlaD family protein [Luteimonas endophytica]MDH5824765.1 MlaD family protein [Luteimonas endophytica]